MHANMHALICIINHFILGYNLKFIVASYISVNKDVIIVKNDIVLLDPSIEVRGGARA